jgi:hypothetical protein
LTEPAAAREPLVQVERFEVEGNTLLPAKRIDAVLARYRGAATLARLREAAAAVQDLYREARFGGVGALLPGQTACGGLVRIRRGQLRGRAGRGDAPVQPRPRVGQRRHRPPGVAVGRRPHGATQRPGHKRRIFADRLSRLEQDPTLADARACRNEREIQTGTCLVTEALLKEIQALRQAARQSAEVAAQSSARATVPVQPVGSVRVIEAALPVIEHKFALLIDINQGRDRRIAELLSAVNDAQGVGRSLEQRFGYKTEVLPDASREDVLRALNRLAVHARSGSKVFETLRDAVRREFPQTPQYGAARAAGQETGTDDLYERRLVERNAPQPTPAPVQAAAPQSAPAPLVTR